MTTSLCILLSAGGKGLRMGTEIPKQFLTLGNKPVALHSFDLFASMPELVEEIVVICEMEYRHLFKTPAAGKIKITFAPPGARRQDSVLNGLQAKTSQARFICIHDAARPFLTKKLIGRVMTSAKEYGAAAAAVPVKSTIKQTNASKEVVCTLTRANLWEIQTPQIIEESLLQRGFNSAQKLALDVTDDVSLVELLGLPVHLAEGSYENLKITTAEDLLYSQFYLAQIQQCENKTCY